MPDSALVVAGRTWTGFADSEEDYADAFVGQQIQPFRIEQEARKMDGTNFIVQGRFRPHAVRDGDLITGQQQYSGAASSPRPAASDATWCWLPGGVPGRRHRSESTRRLSSDRKSPNCPSGARYGAARIWAGVARLSRLSTRVMWAW